VDYENRARNAETEQIVFGMNPHVLGVSDRKPNAGYVHQGKFYDIANRFPPNSVEAMERAHNLQPPYSLAPEIYYKPQPFKVNLQEVVLADLNSISSNIGVTGVQKMFEKMQERFPGRQQLSVMLPDTVARPVVKVAGASILMNTIFEYVDALSTCYAWYGTESGGQALAAAVRGPYDMYDMAARPECICLISPKTFNSRGYTFRGVDYRVTTDGVYSGDYWDTAEQPYERYQEMARKTVAEARAAWETARTAK
jgi:hypothetical protein